jgi:fatty acid desaturase
MVSVRWADNLTSSGVKADYRLAQQCRPLVQDLFVPNPVIYWADLFVTLCVGYTSAGFYLTRRQVDVWMLIALVITAISLYRLALFIHEVAHLRRGELAGFAAAWNVLVGIPLLMPSFLYESHLVHHSSQHYGTKHDGEYLPLAKGSLLGLCLFLLQVLFQPLFVFFRFALGTPLSLMHKGFRRWLLEHASSFVINFRHLRKVAEDGPRTWNYWLELACCLRAWILILVVFMGFAPWTHFVSLYVLVCGTLGMNHLRTLGAHRYRSDGSLQSHDDQFLDSTNITGDLWTEILCPLGLRYHALHHLLPAIPYHNLGIAHRRLEAELPLDSAYRDVTYVSYLEVIRELVGHVRSAS